MKTGYDQFFKNARKAQATETPGKPLPKRQPGPKISAQAQTLKQPQRTNLEMAQELRRRVQPRTKKKKSIPWRLVGTSLVGLVMTLLAMQNLDRMEVYAKKIEISFLGKAFAEEGKKNAPPAAAKTEKAKDKKDESAAKTEANAAAPMESKKEFTTEEIDHFAKMNERKRELDAKEAELNKVEAELQVQKADLEKRLEDLEQTRKNISKVLEEKVQADDKKVDTLVQMYSNMKPQQAAKIFETMDEDLAVEILGRMKKKNAAEVMNLVKPEKAQTFSEKYAGYKRK
jgi:flagellar motility protein MotE (MotC chaperone)